MKARRVNKAGRPWTALDLDKLRFMASRQRPIPVMAEVLGRSETAIVRRLRLMRISVWLKRKRAG